MIRGIDVSHWDNVNIPELPADVGFVAIKATQGASGQDPNFQNTYHTLKTNHPEKARIVYHFFDPTAEGVVQAKNLLSRGVDFTGSGCGPLMLDIEADSGSTIEKYYIDNRAVCIQRINDFIAHIRANSGRNDFIIYSNDDFIKNVICHTWPDTIFWVASYQDNPPPFLPGWPYQFWQYSEFGQLDGTTTGGHLDLDYFTGTQDELNQLANIVS